ncbi:MAG: beta-eliminating lyase-related protein, partial [Verrucomicrobiota bacterium]|nr:beta-eliminating lyase-related protein [Verrucomicrobiota bacterium]
RRFRKQFGGGMRQAGIIAAGALYALHNHRSRLADDHANAKRLAQGLSRLPGIAIDVESVETNIVLFQVTGASATEFVRKLDALGVRMLATGPDTIRAVTNLNVSGEDITVALELIAAVCTGSGN